MVSSPRAAILLSGHVRDTCDIGGWALYEQVDRCRSAFTASLCDVFVHTWDKLNSDTPETSWDCITNLMRWLSPAAVAVQRQETDSLNMSLLWRTSHLSYEAYRLNVAGMVGAMELMIQHASQRRIRYGVALRMRVDIGTTRILRLINGTLSADAWRTLYRAATSPSTQRELRSCHELKRPGAAGADNCFWSAPVGPLVDTLHILRDRFDSLSSMNPSRGRGCLHNSHPESLLRCATRLAGVVAKPLFG